MSAAGAIVSGMTEDEGAPIDDAAMVAVRELLETAERYGIGLSFEPDDGWSIGYMHGMGGGGLSTAYDLETAARAAMRPLDKLHEHLSEDPTSL
jgi:sugar phosphate isomerase/epimerase